MRLLTIFYYTMRTAEKEKVIASSMQMRKQSPGNTMIANGDGEWVSVNQALISNYKSLPCCQSVESSVFNISDILRHVPDLGPCVV